VTQPRKSDRRIQKTRQLLHAALGSLLHEKAYDAIGVKEILDRANVGRSTFYMHFADKDALLLSSIRELLCSSYSATPVTTRPSERLLGFSRRLFEHIDAHRRDDSVLSGRSARDVLHEHLRRVLVQHLTTEMRQSASESHRDRSGELRPKLLAEYVASTFVIVLNSWVSEPRSWSVDAVDKTFRELVLPALSTAFDRP
jgi:AcrR family transcriptional regulator